MVSAKQYKPRKRGKYANQPIYIDGKRFASKLEGRRYGELRLLEHAGEIRDLRTQVRFKLEVNGKLICVYVADFQYEKPGGSVVVEDAKGMMTDVYKLKRALMRAIHGITIVEVYATAARRR